MADLVKLEMTLPEKPTSIATLPLVASPTQEAVMLDRCKVAAGLFNAGLGVGLKTLALMQESTA